ncbi:MAG: bifunctional DNA primase/polymerase, partial [Patescibacteria group bacterium]|nr:bifunctional DNA primase/polymerase [Patescibacteria group bacterium]
MSNPFRDAAPGLWAAGYSAIPLKVRDKRPFLNGWTEYGRALPDAETQSQWLEEWAENNIGVVMGQASGVVALDIDTDDPVIEGLLKSVLPPSPWERIGKKGKVWLYRWTPSTRTFRIDLDGGDRVFELLAGGAQIVVPPSIHPDTGRAYVANRSLAEIGRAELLPLPDNVEMLLREAFAKAGVKLKGKGKSGSAGVVDFVSKGGRDVEMCSKAGLFARAVMRGERTLLEALNEMAKWVEDYVQRVPGDNLDIGKAQKKIAEFVVRDVTGPRKALLPSNWDDGLSLDQKDALGVSLLGDDARKLTPNEIVEYVTVQVSAPGADNEVARTEIAREAARRIAANTDLDTIQEAMLVRFVKGATNVQVPELRKQIADLRKGEIEGLSHQEIAMSAWREMCSEGEIRFDQGCFWRWKGSHWTMLEDHKITSYLGENYSKYPAMRKYNDHLGALKAMRDSSEVNKPLRQIGISGINFVNGFLTTDGVLIDHDLDYGMTYTMPYPYDPAAASRAYRFMAYLDGAWGHDPDYEDKVMSLQEAFGLTLFGEAALHQRAFLLHGKPHSGKSQILNLLAAMMPSESVSNVPPESWGDTFLPAEMVGKLLNIAGEISPTKMIDGDLFKLIVDGSDMQVQRKNQQPFRTRFKAAQWFAGNHLPKTRDSSEGFTRRFVVFDFNKKFDETKEIKDPKLGENIAALEREAVAAWAVEGYLRLKRQGYRITKPASSERRIREMAEANNNVRLFLATLGAEGRIEFGGAKTITVVELYHVYRSFCSGKAGVPAVGLQNFRHRLDELQDIMGFKLNPAEGNNGDVCSGLSLVN